MSSPHPVSSATDHAERRPALVPELSGTELRRWYWLKDELVTFARVLGVSASGDKQVVTDRIAAALDGLAFVAPTRARASASQLTGTLDVATLVPAGQRCSQAVRAWFAAELDHPFHFDARMRDWFAAADGTRTLGDALAHHLDRDPDESRPEIGVQFEYNRFARAWFTEHPDGDATQMRAGWRARRSLPRDGGVSQPDARSH